MAIVVIIFAVMLNGFLLVSGIDEDDKKNCITTEQGVRCINSLKLQL